MSLKLDLQKLLQKEIKQSQPLMNIDDIKEEFMKWLTELRFPAGSSAESWEECLQVFPPKPEEKELESGRRIRLALRLYTRENQYLIALSESLDPESRGVYALSVHVNWQDKEKQQQKQVEQTYTGRFKDSLRPKHILWAQTARFEEINEALSSCAVAILGNELVAHREQNIEKLKFDKPWPAQFNSTEE